jgi:ferredoxin-type protein NapH
MRIQKSTRQRLRKTLLLVSFLLFPITMNYMSPYVIIDGASQGIVNGSLVTFTAMFLAALFIGRLWCGWLCPAGGLMEMTFPINNQPVNGKRMDWIKWLIWAVWIGVILWMVWMAGGYRSVNLLLDTQGGISVAGSPDRPILFAYVIYYCVLAVMTIPGLILGRRAACHSLCWMAPFMISGRKVRNLLHLPALHLQADESTCTQCKTCTTNCPMSLAVNEMVAAQKMEHAECILCGSCIDGCPTRTIRYRFDNQI